MKRPQDNRALLKRHARLLAFVLLAVVTCWGLYGLFASGWTEALAYWRGQGLVLLGAFACTCVAGALDAVGWMWIYRRLGVRMRHATGIGVFLAAHAGQLLPLHLGRLVRPDAIARLGWGSLTVCLKAEVVVLFLDAAASIVLVIGLGACLVHPVVGGICAVVVSVVLLFSADRLATMVSDTRIALPPSFWRQWQTISVLLIHVAAWTFNGVALYLVVRDLPGDIRLLEALFVAPFSAGLGAGTGLPGGIGAIEGLLGISLKTLHVPTAHLALSVAAYRLVNFWVWLPIGWLALILVNRQARSRKQNEDPARPTETASSPPSEA